MDKYSIFLGLMWGLFAQVSFAIGFELIGQTATPDEHGFFAPFFRTILVISFSGIIALLVVIIAFSSKNEEMIMMFISDNKWLYLLGGSIAAILLGEFCFIKGMSVSYFTIVSLTAFLFPVVALIVGHFGSEFPKIFPASKTLTIQTSDYIGFLFLFVGFLLILFRDYFH